MSSSVFFKFKSQKEPTRVEFDGTGISVFELKRDIIIKSGLGDGTDFDLAIYTEDGAEEYDDDTTIIPRSTTVVARRLPSMKPGAGRAARYVSGKMPVTAKNNSRREQTAKTTTKTSSNALAQMSSALTEEERLKAMFAAQSEQWIAQQEELSHQTAVYKPGTGKRPAHVPDHDPPNGYICYRCGEKGHWIQLCPTNDNPEFDNRPRVKRTTGIPKSFLKTVDKATVLGQNGTDDDAKAPSGIMVNADGEFVIAQPDKAAWEQFQARTKSSAAAQKVAVLGEKELQDRGLECPMDKRLFNEPMKTPCCQKTYCSECITNALIESDFICPGCQSEGVLIDNLKADDEMSAKIKAYLDEKEGEKTGTKSPANGPNSPTTANGLKTAEGDNRTKDDASSSKSKSPQPGPASQSAKPSATASPKAAAASTANGEQANPKKRPAEEPAENPRIPRAPKAMQQQEAQQQQQQQQQMMQQMMNGMNPMAMGMPGMMGMGPMPMMNGMNGGFMGGMPGMPNMGNMPMNMGMMNPMMSSMMGMPNNFNGGMSGMNGINGMNGMNGMNGGSGFPMGGGGPHGGGGDGNGWGNNMNPMNGGGGGGGGGFNNNNQHHMNNHHNHNNGGGMVPPFKQFTNVPANEEDAYFRKPVNPQRHQNRQRRVRPSDYREL